MSGHSQFKNIMYRKGAQDAKKARVFAKLARDITIAAKSGLPEPDKNPRLRLAIQAARAESMPKDNIERAIAKASQTAGGNDYVSVRYEGFGPGKVAVIVEAMTDNKNRTAANVRSAFTKGGGNVGTPGSVSYMFDKKGQIIIDKEECGMDPDELMMLALDAGAEDFSEEEDSYEVVTAPEDFSVVREALEAQSIPMMQADVTMIPQTWVELTDEDDIKKLNRTLDLLDEDDDVQAVYHNWDE